MVYRCYFHNLRLDCFYSPFRSLPSFLFVLHCCFGSIVSIYIRANVCIIAYSLKIFCSWKLIHWFVLLLTMMPISPRFSCTNLVGIFLRRFRIICYISEIIADHVKGVNREVAWRSHMTWNDQVFWGETPTTCILPLGDRYTLHGYYHGQISYTL